MIAADGSSVDDVGDENGIRSAIALRAMSRQEQREPHRRPLSSPLSFTETIGSHARTSAPCTEPVQSFPGLKALIGFRLKPVLRPCLAETYLGEAFNPHVRFYGSVRMSGAGRPGPRSRKSFVASFVASFVECEGSPKLAPKNNSDAIKPLD